MCIGRYSEERKLCFKDKQPIISTPHHTAPHTLLSYSTFLFFIPICVIVYLLYFSSISTLTSISHLDSSLFVYFLTISQWHYISYTTLQCYQDESFKIVSCCLLEWCVLNVQVKCDVNRNLPCFKPFTVFTADYTKTWKCWAGDDISQEVNNSRRKWVGYGNEEWIEFVSL